MQNKRRQYRTKPDPWHQLEVSVIRKHGACAAKVFDISGGGIQLTLDSTDAPLDEVGTVLELRFNGDDFPAPITTVGIIVRSEATEYAHHCSLQFIDWIGLSAAIPKAAAKMFNLRSDRRLVMNPANPQEVVIRNRENSFDLRGVLHDLSRGGLAFSTELLSQCILNRVEKIIVEFQPDQCPQAFTFGARIRYRSLVGESLRYGVWFDERASNHFVFQQSVLSAFIDKRLEEAMALALPPNVAK